MLTSIIKATRAHYAALQHRPGPDRVPLDYSVSDAVGNAVTAGTVQVKALPASRIAALSVCMARRQAEMTRLTNRLKSMYPEFRNISVSYRS